MAYPQNGKGIILSLELCITINLNTFYQNRSKKLICTETKTKIIVRAFPYLKKDYATFFL